MTESPFVTTSRIISEPSNTYDLLRIIAKDSCALSALDRDILHSAADELEAAYREIIATHAQLIESRNRQIATLEQLLAARRDAVKKLEPVWTTLFSGPLVTKHFDYGK